MPGACCAGKHCIRRGLCSMYHCTTTLKYFLKKLNLSNRISPRGREGSTSLIDDQVYFIQKKKKKNDNIGRRRQRGQRDSISVRSHLALMNAENQDLKVTFTNFTMGVHYSKQSSALNSLVWLRGTLPYSQRFFTKRFNIQGRLVDQHLVVGVGFCRVVRYPLYQYYHQYDRLHDMMRITDRISIHATRNMLFSLRHHPRLAGLVFLTVILLGLNRNNEGIDL